VDQDEQRKAFIKEMPHPYKKEIETCQHLISYCHQTKIKAGLEVDADEQARQAQQAALIAENQEKINERISGGKLMEASTTSTRDFET